MSGQLRKKPPSLPAAHYGYGLVVYTISFLSAFVVLAGMFLAVAFPGRNAAEPGRLFVALWQESPPREIGVYTSRHLAEAGQHFFHGDALIRLGILVGAGGVGLALLAAAVTYLKRDRCEPLWTVFCLISALLVFVSMAGVLWPAQ